MKGINSWNAAVVPRTLHWTNAGFAFHPEGHDKNSPLNTINNATTGIATVATAILPEIKDLSSSSSPQNNVRRCLSN